jgi:Aerotolerance regulator N-terminal/von Willebrand factor type A domain
MGLLAPLFLAGIAAVGLPVWLHFLRRNTSNPFRFSSLMFFERRTESSIQPKRLRYLLLLAMRMALLVLLALAFANPFVNRTTVYAGRKPLTVIAIDRSFSMRYANRMEQARAKAMSILNGLPSRSQSQVIAVDAHVENLTEPTVDRETLQTAIASVQAGDLASSYAEFIRSLRSMEQNSRVALDVHFISDMQQSSMPAAFADLQVGPHTSLSLVPVDNAKAPNWAVEQVNAAPHVFDPTQVRVSAIIAGTQTKAAARKVSLTLDGKLVATKDLSIPPSSRGQVEFAGFPVSYGAHRGEIRIEPGDALPNDDRFPFSIERSDPRVVLFVGNGRPRDSFYLKAALEAAQATGLTLQIVNNQQTGGEDFSRYAFVVLSDTGTINENVEHRLTEYVRRGGALLVLAGPEMARVGRVPLTHASLTVNRQTQGAGLVDNAHPALNGLGALQNVQFYTTDRIDVPPGARVLAKLADNNPLLTEQTIGEGRVLTFASTFDGITNDFPLHKSFLPFIAQAGGYLAGANDAMQNVMAGSPVELRKSRGSGTAVDVIGPTGAHELSLQRAASAQYFVPSTEGFYEVHRANGQRFVMAVHADRRESDLTPVPAETLALWHNTGTSQPLPGASGEEHQTHPQTFWQFLVILVIGAALTESIFGSRYLREERAQHDSSRSTERVFAKT